MLILFPLIPSLVLLAVASLVVLGVTEYLDVQRKRKALGHIPIVGDAPYWKRRLKLAERDTDHVGLLIRGYKQFTKNGRLWAFWGQHDDFTVVVPIEMTRAIKNISHEQLCFQAAVEDSFRFTLHTRMTNRVHVDIVRQFFNKNSTQLHDICVTEANAAIPEILKDATLSGTQEVNATLLLGTIIQRISVALILGHEFAADAKLMTAIMAYSWLSPGVTRWYFGSPVLLRGIVGRICPPSLMLHFFMWRFKKGVMPMLKERLASVRGKNEKTRTAGSGFVESFLGLKLQATLDRGVSDDVFLNTTAEELLFVIFETGPTIFLAVHTLFECIVDPKLSSQLLEEIRCARESTGGRWSDTVFTLTPKLESVSREVMRLNNPAMISATRVVVTRDIQICGVPLPKGTMICSPNRGIHTDDSIYSSASTFNPYRFYDADTNTCIARATSPSEIYLPFGYGSQACPGRYIGVRIAQLVVAMLLDGFEFEFVGEKGRPRNMVFGIQMMPDLDKVIRVRRRVG